MQEPATQNPKWRLPALRVTLRAFLVIVLLAGAGLGFVLIWVRGQRDAVAAIESAGGKVVYEWGWHDGNLDPYGKPTWLQELAPDLFARVKYVRIGESANAASAAELMENIGHLRDLAELNLNAWSNLKDEDLAPIVRLKELQNIDLSVTGTTGRSLRFMRGLSKPKSVSLGGPVTDADLANAAGLTSLEVFGASGDVSDEGLMQLKGLVNVKSFGFGSPRITNAGLAVLRDMTKLESLSIGHTQVNSLEPIKHLTRLTYLGVVASPLDDAGIAPIETFTHLTTLCLNETNVGNAGLAHVANLKGITHLYLEHTKVTDAGLAHVGKLSALQCLWLNDTAVGDAGLQLLADLNELALLFVERTRVTDAGILRLNGLKSCTQVAVAGTAVTNEGITAARAKRPTTRFVRMGY